MIWWKKLFGVRNKAYNYLIQDKSVMTVPEFVKLIEQNIPGGGLLFVTQGRRVRCSSCDSTVDADNCLETSTSLGAIRLSCPSCGAVWNMLRCRM